MTPNERVKNLCSSFISRLNNIANMTPDEPTAAMENFLHGRSVSGEDAKIFETMVGQRVAKIV